MVHGTVDLINCNLNGHHLDSIPPIRGLFDPDQDILTLGKRADPSGLLQGRTKIIEVFILKRGQLGSCFTRPSHILLPKNGASVTRDIDISPMNLEMPDAATARY